MKKLYTVLLASLFMCVCSVNGRAGTDTLRVMAYNVLNYGSYPLCQGPNSVYHGYLQTIVQFANPDIIGLEKMGSIQISPTDHNYTAEIDFQDSILKYVLDLSFPGRFNYCPFTNFSASGTECLVFYNQQKLGFVARTCTYYNGVGNEDFNTYKLYYKDPNLATTHDTTFLYVTDNHDISGNSNFAQRGVQIAGEMAQIKTHFTHLANMINMGDFNVRNSSESVYQTLTAPADSNFRYYDPPFYPDATVSYPADWDGSPNTFAKFLTTSTRVSATIPNSCGTSGGAKDWYDHIFLSPWIINNANYISYIPKSFRVIGNDGNRLSVSVNDAPTNNSAPSAVINALFQMSNKYPVMVDLLVAPNTTGVSPADPEIVAAGVHSPQLATEHISMVDPVSDKLTLHLSDGLTERLLTVTCYDMYGRMIMNEVLTANSTIVQMPLNIHAGTYIIMITDQTGFLFRQVFVKM